MSQQIEPCILPNQMPGRLIAFYGAKKRRTGPMPRLGRRGRMSDPFTWRQDEANPIFVRQERLGFGELADTVMYIPEEDAYYIYYSGTIGNVQDRIGLAICPVGADGYSDVTADAIKRYGDAPVLAPEAAGPYHEEMASQAAVMREWNAAEKRWDWYMYYSYRGKDGVLPGIRLATSRDGKNWTRQFNKDDPRGMGQIFQGRRNAYDEGHQIRKIDNTYVLCIEVGVDHGALGRLAVSNNPVKGWTQLDLDTVLRRSGRGTIGERTLYHVATPAFYQIEGNGTCLYGPAVAPAMAFTPMAWEMWGVVCTA